MEAEFYDPELELLDPSLLDDSALSMPDHTLRMAPVLTGDALHLLGTGFIPQRALYGRVISQRGEGFRARPTNPKIYINTNTPFSALVCGVQVRPGFSKIYSCDLYQSDALTLLSVLDEAHKVCFHHGAAY